MFQVGRSVANKPAKPVDIDGKRVLVLVPQWNSLTVEERKRMCPGEFQKTDPIRRTLSKSERRVIGKARLRNDMEFVKRGSSMEYEKIEAGTILEVLEPNELDRRDQEHQAKLDGKQLVVVRMNGRAVLVYGTQLERM